MPPAFEPLHAELGVEVRGVDLREPRVDWDALREALATHALLVVRKQQLSGSDLAAVGARFGAGVSAVKRFETAGPSPDQAWHAVGSIEGDPATATVLCVREAPARGGGMAFTSTRALLARQSEADRRALEEITAVHAFRAAPDVRVSYPLVVRRSGDAPPALLLGYHVVDTDTRPSIAALMADATSTEHVYRHDFASGDVLVWDNWSLMHRACALRAGERRAIEEVAVARA